MRGVDYRSVGKRKKREMPTPSSSVDFINNKAYRYQYAGHGSANCHIMKTELMKIDYRLTCLDNTIIENKIYIYHFHIEPLIILLMVNKI